MTKKFKKLLALVLAVVMTMSLMSVSVFAEGDDEGGEPAQQTTPASTPASSNVTVADWDASEITLMTKDDLLAFAEKAKNGETFKNKTVTLGADIDLSGTYWYHRDENGAVQSDYRIPEFEGTFDGNGYTIKNLSYKDNFDEASGYTELAFILYSKVGAFEDIHIDGISVDTAANSKFAGLVFRFYPDDVSAENRVPGPYAEDCVVENIRITAESNLTFGGMFHAVVDVASISDCLVDSLDVTVKGEMDDDYARCGGFFATGGEKTTFERCSVSNFTVNAQGGGSYLGGFVGGASMTAQYKNCSVSNFKADIGGKIHSVGGFAGYSAGSAWGNGMLFENCSVTGLDITTSSETTCAAGFIGNIFGKSTVDEPHLFKECTAAGRIVSTDSYISYAAGFVGWLYGLEVKNGGCAATFESCSTAVDITNPVKYGGGFACKYLYKQGTNRQMITSYSNCTSTGDVFSNTLAVGSFLNTADDDSSVCGILGGTYSYDPDDRNNSVFDGYNSADSANNVADGYRALNNGDGTWTVFPDTETPKEIVELTFQLWDAEQKDYADWRTIEMYADTDMKDSAFDNANPAVKDGYRFDNGLSTINDAVYKATGQYVVGWYNKADDSSFTEETLVKEDTTVYAKTGFLVTFDSNGGSRVNSVRVEAGKTVSRPTDPTRSGYDFIGWYLNNTPYSFSTPVTENITLVAKWERVYVDDDDDDDEPVKPVEIKDEDIPLSGDPLYLNTTDHFAYLTGFADGTLRPYNGITRGQLATIFFRLLTDEAREEFQTETNSFTDCGPDLWCNTAVSTLSRMGIISGYQDGTFRPNARVTRAQLAKIAVGFFNTTLADYEGLYSDVADGLWYTPYVEAASRMELIRGYADGTFRPDAEVTRAQACVILNRVLNRVSHKDHLLDPSLLNTYSDCTAADWFYADMMEATNSHSYQWLSDGESEALTEQWLERLADRDWTALEKH